MEKNEKYRALKVITDVVQEYEIKLKNKHFLIIYQEKEEMKHTCVGFRDANFLHLTGVKCHFTAQRFYEICIDGKLSERDFELDKQGRSRQKLMVLSQLPNLLYNNCMIGNFIGSGIFIQADYFVGNTKAVLSVGF